jgi:hypothetical protein
MKIDENIIKHGTELTDKIADKIVVLVKKVRNE